MKLHETPRWIPPTADRVPINIHPDVQKALVRFLTNDERWLSVGYSEFIMRALYLAMDEEES